MFGKNYRKIFQLTGITAVLLIISMIFACTLEPEIAALREEVIGEISSEVIFNSNGGSEVLPQYIAKDGNVTLPTHPKKSGSTFGWWFKEAKDFKTPWDFVNGTVNEPMTLYAKWNKEGIYTVVFFGNGGTPEFTWDETAGDPASIGTMPANPSRKGYTFEGWVDESGTAFVNANIKNSTAIYAKWKGINAVVPIIITQPAPSTSVTLGNPAPLSVTAAAPADGGVLSYQWYSNTSPSNSGGNVISGATKNTYNPPVNATGTFHYYVVVTNTNNNATGNKTASIASSVATVTVTGPTNVIEGSGSDGGFTWDNGKITGSFSGYYKVVEDGVVKYLDSSGLLQSNLEDIGFFSGSEIPDLVNGRTYKLNKAVDFAGSSLDVFEHSGGSIDFDTTSSIGGTINLPVNAGLDMYGIDLKLTASHSYEVWKEMNIAPPAGFEPWLESRTSAKAPNDTPPPGSFIEDIPGKAIGIYIYTDTNRSIIYVPAVTCTTTYLIYDLNDKTLTLLTVIVP